MKEFLEELKLSLKVQFRVPISIFFSLFFPLLMMILIVSSYKNFSIGNGYHFIDKYLFISTGIGLIPITVISFPINLGEDIEEKIYKRLDYLGVNIKKYISAELCSFLVISILSIILNIVFAHFVFNAKLPRIEYLLAYIVQCEYCVLVGLILGAIIAIIIKSTKILLPFGMVVLFTFYIFSGVFVQYNDLSKIIRKIGSYIPWKYIMNNFFGIWKMKEFWNITFLKINTIWFVILVIILSVFIVLNKYKREIYRGKTSNENNN